jgi:queuine tRNA-ribosyltransferase
MALTGRAAADGVGAGAAASGGEAAPLPSPAPPVPPPGAPWEAHGPPLLRRRCGAALEFELHAECGRARAATLHMVHGRVRTPVFMPVGTQGSVKGLGPRDLCAPALDCDIVLGNTYHLGHRPGPEVVGALGGLHAMMGWRRCLLTDSGGFQMVSLLQLATVTEAGVEFTSPHDGSRLLLTPEQSMGIQNVIGADIMMALDDVVGADTTDRARFVEATARTTRWLDRCLAAHARPEAQSLFAIVQGGLDVAPGGLRDASLAGLLARDAQLPGYAIGGLAGGEAKDDFWRVVAHCTARLPRDKPRYLMGVGYPLDLVVCSALGVDMYDCVWPTRTARFGVAVVPWGLLKLRGAGAAADPRPIDPRCGCAVCAAYSRAHLASLWRQDAAVAAQLVTVHNIAYMMALVRGMRAAVLADAYPAFVRAFLRAHFLGGSDAIPRWVADALAHAGIETGCWSADDGRALEDWALAQPWGKGGDDAAAAVAPREADQADE